MYAKAQEELYGRSVLETKQGFIVYKAFEDSSVYLHLIFIDKSFRDNGIGTELVDQVVSITSAKTLFSYVDLTTNNPELSIQAHIGYGFKISNADSTSITFKKEI